MKTALDQSWAQIANVPASRVKDLTAVLSSLATIIDEAERVSAYLKAREECELEMEDLEVIDARCVMITLYGRNIDPSVDMTTPLRPKSKKIHEVFAPRKASGRERHRILRT
jgi:hypothetical protein